MPATQTLINSGPSSRKLPFAAPVARPRLTSIVYRSRAVGPLPRAELRALVSLAQARNRSEDITGVVVYDRDRFFQWLEGPENGIARVLSSIQRDPRHADVEVLKKDQPRERLFAEWNMKLAVGPRHGALQTDVLMPGASVLDDLHRDAAGVADSLSTLAPVPRAAEGVAAQIQALLDSHILPELLLRHPHEPDPANRRELEQHAADLVPLLLAQDSDGAETRLDVLCGLEPNPAAACARLSDVVARRLSEAWAEDVLSEFYIQIALCRLRNGLRRLTATAWMPIRPPELAPRVLVSSYPDEPHLLGAALVSALLTGEGWHVQSLYPNDERELRDAVAAMPFDAVHISLSPVFRRDHWLPRMANTLAKLRFASLKREVAMLVGGRVFAERDDAGKQAGADDACAHPFEAASAILRAIRDRQPSMQ